MIARRRAAFLASSRSVTWSPCHFRDPMCKRCLSVLYLGNPSVQHLGMMPGRSEMYLAKRSTSIWPKPFDRDTNVHHPAHGGSPGVRFLTAQSKVANAGP